MKLKKLIVLCGKAKTGKTTTLLNLRNKANLIKHLWGLKRVNDKDFIGVFDIKGKKVGIENTKKNSIIYNNILNYKPKESKEELKKMSKSILKRAAVASLAALVTIPNIVPSMNPINTVYATSIDFSELDPVYQKQILHDLAMIEKFKKEGKEQGVQNWTRNLQTHLEIYAKQKENKARGPIVTYTPEQLAELQALQPQSSEQELDTQNTYEESQTIDYYEVSLDAKKKIMPRLQELSAQSLNNIHGIRTFVKDDLAKKGQNWGYMYIFIDDTFGTDDNSWDEWFLANIRANNGNIHSSGNKITFNYTYNGEDTNVLKKGDVSTQTIYWKPSQIGQEIRVGYILTPELAEVFDEEALQIVKSCYENFLSSHPNISNDNLKTTVKQLLNIGGLWGDKVKNYVTNLALSVGVS